MNDKNAVETITQIMDDRHLGRLLREIIGIASITIDLTGYTVCKFAPGDPPTAAWEFVAGASPLAALENWWRLSHAEKKCSLCDQPASVGPYCEDCYDELSAGGIEIKRR